MKHISEAMMEDDNMRDMIEAAKEKSKDMPLVRPGRPNDCAPHCKICNGLGVVSLDVELDNPRFGRLFPCENLPIESERFDITGLMVKERHYTWQHVKPMDETIVTASKEIQAVLERGYGMVLLYGDCGLGKSLLLKIAVAETMRKSHYQWQKYTQWQSIYQHMLTAYGSDVENPARELKDIMNDYTMFSLLAIDELGLSQGTQFAQAQEFTLIDNRYTAAIENQLPFVTLIATNLTPGELPARLRSRLFDNRCLQFKLEGEDYRLGADWNEE